MTPITYGSMEAQGREFKGSDDYSWFMINSGGKLMYAKMKTSDLFELLQGRFVELWNIWGVTVQGLAYMSAMSKCLEPFYLCKADLVAPVHPEEGKVLDAETKKITATIITASAGDMPKTKPKFQLE